VLGSAAAASATVQPVAGTARLNGVACPTTTCVAVGLNPDGQGGEQGVVVPVTNGVPGSAVVVPGTARLAAVACSSTTTCEAVGLTSSNPSASQGVVVPVTNGTPGTAQPVAGTTGLDGVACPAAGTCVAVGDNSSYQGVVVPVTNGAPGSAQAVPGTTTLDGVACPTATTCEAIGGLGLVPITNGTPGPAQPGPVGAALVGVACPTASTCEAVGTNNSTGQGAVVPVVNGTPGAVQTVAGSSYLFGVACPTASRCETAGLIYTSAGAGSDGVVAAVAIQTVVSLSFDNGAVSQYTLGYQHALQPQGVKATFYINTGVMGGANHLSWSQLSALHSAGQEIGGKTVDGTSLTTLSASQQTAEICNDRQALLSHGLSPAGFAYPAGAFNTTIESEVQGCGYNNARTAGSLSPAGPGYAETLPPKNWLALRAYAPTGQVTLANLEALVTGAASHGNGWIPIVIQKICSQTADPNNYATCTSSSGWIDLADLNTFLTWVNNAGQPGGAPAGTVFSPVGATATSLGQPPS
jgi:peptidoglycan/xylan/chitin deacetylase (PgdA/CDA1 family)